MKGLFWTLLLIGVALTLSNWTSVGVWYNWTYPKTFESYLRLSDDASLPDQKAAYLEKYLEQVSTITGPPRYIFKKPDLDLAKQKINLQGLIQRYKDVAKIDPSEMAYQTGMGQLNEETAHQLDRISGIFQSAKLRESFMFFFWIYFLSWLIPVISFIICSIVYEVAYN